MGCPGMTAQSLYRPANPGGFCFIWLFNYLAGAPLASEVTTDTQPRRAGCFNFRLVLLNLGDARLGNAILTKASWLLA